MSREVDEQALREILGDGVQDECPVLCTALCFSPTMQKELAVLLMRAYQTGKEVGSRK